jgi:hypothetical protein
MGSIQYFARGGHEANPLGDGRPGSATARKLARADDPSRRVTIVTVNWNSCSFLQVFLQLARPAQPLERPASS